MASIGVATPRHLGHPVLLHRASSSSPHSPRADDFRKGKNQESLLCHNSEILSLCRQETALITESIISACMCINAQGKN